MRYLTNYKEYPIFAPEEGGYYYEGNEVVSSERMSKRAAKRELKRIYDELIVDFPIQDGKNYPVIYMTENSNEVRAIYSKYIGDSESWVIERKLGSQKSGWTPYY